MSATPILLGQLREAVRIVPGATEFHTDTISLPIPTRRSIDPRATISQRAPAEEQVRLDRRDTDTPSGNRRAWVFDGYVIVEFRDGRAVPSGDDLKTALAQELGSRCLELRLGELKGNVLKLWAAFT